MIVWLCRSLSAQKVDVRLLLYRSISRTSTQISITVLEYCCAAEGLGNDAPQGPAGGRSFGESTEA